MDHPSDRPKYDTGKYRKNTLRQPEKTSPSTDDLIKESWQYGSSARKQTLYTIRDYLAYPEDQRVELINGVFYAMAAPTIIHQMVSAQLWMMINSYILEKGGPCLALYAPVDVQLDKDDYTMVQPDVLVVCDPNRYKDGNRIYGAPDFIAEILSPSNPSYDLGIKVSKYMNAGVREYWVIDSTHEKVYVYVNEESLMIRIYSFEDRVPMQVYQGDCVIDFRRIRSHLARYIEL